ncbi:MAG: hypothetical protein LC737_07275, partial [Chloroflexi bacterium]|nr:hypothetical protein [Chloroflexota bacterium]
RGALMRANGHGWTATPLIESISVPDTLQGLLMARLDRLPDETKSVVQQASVIGRVFLYRVLLQMSQDHDSLDADLSHLEREELIRERAHDPEIEYVFKHALTQEVAYQSLLAPRRRDLHRRVGEAMETVFAERRSEFSSIVGKHMLRGELWHKAADYLIQAGDAAARLYAHAEAREQFNSALDALAHLPATEDNHVRRVDTTVKLVSVSIVSDDPAKALARLEQIEPTAQTLLGADEQSREAQLRLARVHYWMGRAQYYRANLREAVGFYREALAVGQRYGDEELMAIPSSVIGQALTAQGQWGKAEALLAQAIPLLEKTASWQNWVRATIYYGLSLAAQGRYAEGMTAGERGLARAVEMNDRTSIGVSYVIRALIYFMGNDMQRVMETALQLRPVAEQAGDRMYVWVTYGYEGWAQSRLGNQEAAVALMKRQHELMQQLGGRIVLGDWFAAADAEIALRCGRVADALALAQQAVAGGQAMGSVFSPGLAHRVWAQALAASEPPQWDEAATHMAESARSLEAGEAFLESARTHVAWGDLCRACNDLAAAREHYEIAAQRFESAGLGAELEQTRQCLSELGTA